MERLDRFMARANAAYYASRDPFAEFTTAPEITQAFGEVLGAWCAAVWDTMGRPDPFVLAELGPGRGTLMADALRVLGRVAPPFVAAARVHLVETSPLLRTAQAARVPGATWHNDASSLPPGPLLLLANEFLDALPVRQFVQRDGVAMERHVCNGAWAEQPADDAPENLREGEVVERGDPGLALVSALAARIARDGGAALFVDYGPARPEPGSSLQALRDGKPADPLAEAGNADLTAHVDFAGLAAAARAAGAAVHGPEAQGLFLARIGLFQRTDRLARGQPPLEAQGLVRAAQRLAEPAWMGRLFKAMCVCHPVLPQPPGFSA